MIALAIFVLWDVFLQLLLTFSRGTWTISSWLQWDAGHYLALAGSGYTQAYQAAFFPFYPFLIKTVSSLGISLSVSAFLLNQCVTLGVCLLLYKITRAQFGKKEALWTLILFLSFPTSFFLIAGYSEALFLLLTLSFFTCLKRKKYLLSAVFVVLGTLTRSVGLILLLSFWIFLWKEQKLPRRFFYMAVSLLGVFSLMIIDAVQFGDPLLFLTAQQFWQRSFSTPWQVVLLYVVNFLNAPFFRYMDILAIIEFVITAFFLFLTGAVMVQKRFSVEQKLYVFGACLLPLFGGNLASMPRYVLAVYPAFQRLTQLLGNGFMRVGLTIIFLSFLSIFVRLFWQGIWIA
ncbi:MAG TPA: mannosyltransferase family protein [Patescibacteria group bacterium]|nr:mannosyltransferase family protein [Patescibacteria group bacterium]